MGEAFESNFEMWCHIFTAE